MARLVRNIAYQLFQGNVNQVHGDQVWKKLGTGLAFLGSECLCGKICIMAFQQIHYVLVARNWRVTSF
jgi:hypothetical protein